MHVLPIVALWFRAMNARASRLLFAIVPALLTGCGTSARPEPALRSAQFAMDEAYRLEADRYAASELNTAEQKLALAERNMAQGEEMRAQRLAEQAALDARYALAKAQAARAKELRSDAQITTDTLNQATGGQG